jgi:transketolase
LGQDIPSRNKEFAYELCDEGLITINRSIPSDPATRVKFWRKKVLDISQQVSALHVAPAFSCMEIVDCIYFDLMRNIHQKNRDIFIMSKGHGCMAQYVVLNALGFLSDGDLELYCKPSGRLGAHPDYGNPGIHASTGSLGHGLGIALGQAYAEKLLGADTRIFCLLSDGELQEGSTWESVMMAANLEMKTLTVFVDFNDFGGLERMSDGHKAFYPIVDKFEAFGWDAVEIDGHSNSDIISAFNKRNLERPLALICRTTKGKGVSFMENSPIWHYRSPTREEYSLAINELSS